MELIQNEVLQILIIRYNDSSLRVNQNITSHIHPKFVRIGNHSLASLMISVRSDDTLYQLVILDDCSDVAEYCIKL